MTTAAQPFVSATEVPLLGWTGPVEWLDTFRNPESVWRVSAYGAGGMANGTDPARVRLDTRRREVQHLLCDRLALPEWVCGSEWCAALVWWAGVAGRPLSDVLGVWRLVTEANPDTGATWIRQRLYDPRNQGGGLWACELVQPWRAWAWENSCVYDHATGLWRRGPETGDAGKAAADAAALAHDCALLNIVDGRLVLTLPPLVAGGGPIVWTGG